MSLALALSKGVQFLGSTQGQQLLGGVASIFGSRGGVGTSIGGTISSTLGLAAVKGGVPPSRRGVLAGRRIGGRRMNVANTRALRRAIGRVRGFTKLAQRVGSYTSPGRPYRLKGFARRRKR